jgi:hypothetical protein
MLQRGIDLDVLLFFARHPRSLLARDALARLLGYPLDEIAASLDSLTKAGVVAERSGRNGPSAARLYVLSMEMGGRVPLSALLDFASSRAGRLALRAALAAPVRPPAVASRERAHRPSSGHRNVSAVAFAEMK